MSDYGPKAKIRMARYYQNHKEERKQKGKEYAQKTYAQRNAYSRAYLDRNKERSLLYSSRKRAKFKGLEHNIELEDIIIPEFCPLLGLTLTRNPEGLQANSPTLDRIDSTKGYIKGNVWVISHRANTIKNNSSIEEFGMIFTNWKIKLDE